MSSPDPRGSVGDIVAWAEAALARSDFAPRAFRPPTPEAWTEDHAVILRDGPLASAKAVIEWRPCGWCRGSPDGLRLVEVPIPREEWPVSQMADGHLAKCIADPGIMVRVHAEPCVCGGLLARLAAFNRANIPSKVAAINLPRGWIRADYSDWTVIQARMLQLVDGWRPGATGVLIYGPPGTGKSTMAGIIATLAALRHGADVAWLHWGDLCDEAAPRLELETRNRIRGAELVVVDEVGGQRGTPFRRDLFAATIGWRLDAGLSVIMTSNIDPKKSGNELVVALGERGQSRVANLDVVLMDGPDRRQAS